MLAVPTKPGKPRLFNGFRLPRCGCCVPPCNHCQVWASQFSSHQKLGFFVFFCPPHSLILSLLGGKNDIGGLDDSFGLWAFSQSWGKGFTLEGGANTLLWTGGSNTFVTLELGTISGRFSKLGPEETRLKPWLRCWEKVNVVRTLNYEFTTEEFVWMHRTLCILVNFFECLRKSCCNFLVSFSLA